MRPCAAPAKSISRDHTFGEDVSDFGRLFHTLSALCERIAGALRSEQAAARTIRVRIRYADFKTESRSTTLPTPTRDDRLIFAVARESLLALYRRRVRLRLLGVAAAGLSSPGWQQDFFEAARNEALERLYAGMDRIRGRYGFGAILRGESLGC
ncbi:MAG: DNA polymerase IV [candidate division BRC1 bacterium ADurb.BinA364]|nr:MAG: DNA polymerase IV [candidate division BRC1 bacterium ADurb.BinA364]